MFFRFILILLGAWLFSRLWRLVSASFSSRREELGKHEEAETVHPFREEKIQEGEFEDLEEKRKSSGKP